MTTSSEKLSGHIISGRKNPARYILILCTGWMLATAVPAFIAVFSAGALVTRRVNMDQEGPQWGGPSSMTGDNALAPLCLWATCLMFMVGPAIGIGQGLVLRAFVRGVPPLRWALVTSCGVALSLMIYIIPFVGVLLTGAIVAFAQGLVLRHHIQKAEWWVGGSAAAWVVATAVTAATRDSILPRDWVNIFPSWPFYPLSSVLYWAVVCGIAVALYAALSGAVLAYLLSRYAVAGAKL